MYRIITIKANCCCLSQILKGGTRNLFIFIFFKCHELVILTFLKE